MPTDSEDDAVYPTTESAEDPPTSDTPSLGHKDNPIVLGSSSGDTTADAPSGNRSASIGQYQAVIMIAGKGRDQGNTAGKGMRLVISALGYLEAWGITAAEQLVGQRADAQVQIPMCLKAPHIAL